MRDYFKGKFPGWTVEKVTAQTKAATGVYRHNLCLKISERDKRLWTIITHRKPERLKQKVRSEKTYDHFLLSAIRRVMHRCSMDKMPPTLKKVTKKWTMMKLSL